MLDSEKNRREINTYEKLMKAELDLYLGPVRRKFNYPVREIVFDKNHKRMTWEEYLNYMRGRPNR